MCIYIYTHTVKYDRYLCRRSIDFRALTAETVVCLYVFVGVSDGEMMGTFNDNNPCLYFVGIIIYLPSNINLFILFYDIIHCYKFLNFKF